MKVSDLPAGHLFWTIGNVSARKKMTKSPTMLALLLYLYIHSPCRIDPGAGAAWAIFYYLFAPNRSRK